MKDRYKIMSSKVRESIRGQMDRLMKVIFWMDWGMGRGIFNVLLCKDYIFIHIYLNYLDDGEYRGVRYEGGWKYGLRHGYGVTAYKDGTIYKGTW